MRCICCGKIEPESRWNERFGKHELCESCLKYHEHAKSKYITYVMKQAGIKNLFGYLTVKAMLRDSKETLTIIEERPIDRVDFGALIYELEDALKNDVVPDEPLGYDVVRYVLTKPKYKNKVIRLSNSEINNMIQAYYNTDTIVCIEYSDYPKKTRLKL